MKKITYLVAPLMVLPFLVGCNKGKTHTVSISELSSDRVVFADKSGKEITLANPINVNDGQDFVFTVTAKQSNDDKVPYTINKDYVFAFRGADDTPLEMKFEQGSDKTTATCTIAGKDVTDGISLAGIEHVEGYYLVDFVYLLGTQVFLDETHTTSKLPLIYEQGNWYAYAPIDGDLTIDFTVDLESEDWGVPDADNIVLVNDMGDFDQPKAKDYWATYDKPSGVLQNGHLLIKKDSVQYSLFVAARASTSSLLNHMEWDEIKSVSESGFAPYLFELGETKTVEINKQKHLVKIIGFDHDKREIDGGDPITYGLTFQFATAISDETGKAITINWNDSTFEGTNYNFIDSTLNKALKGKIYDLLPTDLKDVIGEVTKKVAIYSTGKKAWEATSYPTKLFPLSYYELGSSKSSYADPDEGGVYEYYKGTTGLSTKRIVHDAAGSLAGTPYWERSPFEHSTAHPGLKVFAVDSTGTINANGKYAYNHGNEYGMAPAFCI